jgi:excisionase family DNA binding protein
MHSATVSRYVTTAQAAELLAVTPDKITDLIHSGQLPAIDVSLHSGGKARWRIAADDLAAFIASRRTSPPAKRTRRSRRKDEGPRYY